MRLRRHVGVTIVNKKFPTSILQDYNTVMFSDWRKKQWREYWQNHNEFVREQKRKRNRLHFLQVVHRFSLAQKVYERKKYPEIITPELCREL